jgi:hypothetical protein
MKTGIKNESIKMIPITKLKPQCSALVHNFNNIFSSGHMYGARQSMNFPPPQILGRCGSF